MGLHENDLAAIAAMVEGATDTQINKVVPTPAQTGSNYVEMSTANIRDVAFAWRDGWPSITDPLTGRVSLAGSWNDWRRKYRPVVGTGKSLSKEQVQAIVNKVKAEYALRKEPLGVNIAPSVDGLQVSFSYVRTGGNPPNSHSWNFGDGSPASTDTNPSHTYADYGDYVVTLDIGDVDGESAQETTTVSMAEPV